MIYKIVKGSLITFRECLKISLLYFGMFSPYDFAAIDIHRHGWLLASYFDHY